MVVMCTSEVGTSLASVHSFHAEISAGKQFFCFTFSW